MKQESKQANNLQFQMCNCNRPNCSHHIPRNFGLYTSEDWAKGWVKKITTFVEIHKKYGEVILQDLPHFNSFNRGEYDLENFVADTWIGDLPWDNSSKEVQEIAKTIPGFIEACGYIEEKSNGKISHLYIK